MFLKQMHKIVFKTAAFTRIGVLLTVLSLSHSSLKYLAIGVITAEISFFLVYARLNRENINWSSIIKTLLIDIAACAAIGFSVKTTGEKLFDFPPVAVFVTNSTCTILLCVFYVFCARKTSWIKIKNSLNLT
jgi:hypothetical protein